MGGGTQDIRNRTMSAEIVIDLTMDSDVESRVSETVLVDEEDQISEAIEPEPASPIEFHEVRGIIATLAGDPTTEAFTIAILRAHHTEEAKQGEVLLQLAPALVGAACALLGSLRDEVVRAITVLRIVERMMTKKRLKKYGPMSSADVEAFEKAARRLVALSVSKWPAITRAGGADTMAGIFEASERLTGFSVIPRHIADYQKQTAPKSRVFRKLNY